MYNNPVRIYILLGMSRTLLNNVKVLCVGKDEYGYISFVRSTRRKLYKDRLFRALDSVYEMARCAPL
jgi:hypothetical protein